MSRLHLVGTKPLQMQPLQKKRHHSLGKLLNLLVENREE